MTFADMVLAHAILEELAPDCINLVLDLLEGDPTLHLHAVPMLTELVRTLEYEFSAGAHGVCGPKAVLMPLGVSLGAGIQA